jgi:hypothetical protein
MSVPRQGEGTATGRFESRFRVLASNGTTPQVDGVTHTKAITERPPTATAKIPASSSSQFSIHSNSLRGIYLQ